MQHSFIKKCVYGSLFLSLMGAVGCGDDSSSVKPETPISVDKDIFENIEVSDVDVESYTITLEDGIDSFVVNSLNSLGGSKFFIALDKDPYEPMVDWDRELSEGSVVYANDDGEARIVAMDDSYRVVSVWIIKFTGVQSSSSGNDESSSSSEAGDSSSSEAPKSSGSVESSSSVEASSSSEAVESSSSETPESSGSEESSSSSEAVESSSSETPESSGSEESSSSVEASSSSEAEDSSSSEVAESSSSEEGGVPGFVSVNQLAVEGATVNVDGDKIFVEFPYSETADLKKVKFTLLEDVVDLLSPKEMKFADQGVVNTYSVSAGMQLPGTDFASRVASFWGTTSAAMGTNRTVSGRRVTSNQNATFSNSKLTLTSREVSHVTMGGFLNLSVTETHGQKLAGGFYFAGSYSGANALDIYQIDYVEGTPDDEVASDLTPAMTMGKPFSGRPVSFDVSYTYYHVDNVREEYPQQDLIYVILASEDNKIVASGFISDKDSVEYTTKTVTLDYGSDNGLLESKYPLPPELSLGTGSEDVSTIYVLFASSAYAYVVEGGPVADDVNEANYRGGISAQLIVDAFKLNY